MRHTALRIATACALLITGLAFGWLVASSMGRDFLRHDLEVRLSKLLRGEVKIGAIQFELHSGLALRGTDISVYPSKGGPGLYGREVYAELNVPALLLGDFQLADLTVEDLAVGLQLDPAGVWKFPPLRALQERSTGGPPNPEARLLIGAADAVTRVLMRARPIADLVSVRGGVVRFEDRSRRDAQAVNDPSLALDPASETLQLRLDGLRADLSRPWGSGEALLRLSGLLVDPGRETSVPIQIRGHSDPGGRRNISLSVDGLDLDVLDRYTALLGPHADLDGSIDGTFAFEFFVGPHLRDEKFFEADLDLEDIVSTLPARQGPIELPLPLSKLRMRLEMHEETLRLTDVLATGDAIRIVLDATVSRPLAANSRGRISAEIRGTSINEVQPVLAQLPEETRAALGVWFDSLKSGRFDRLGISGAAPLRQWGELARGELDALPDGFLLNFRVSDVTAVLDNGASIEDLGFEATWTEEQLEIAEANGIWQGEPLPTFDVTISGIEQFLGHSDSRERTEAPPIGGSSYLWELVSTAGTERAADTEASDPRKLEVDLDFLDHPLIGWPLERARIKIEPLTNGTQITVSQGEWGGAPIHGEAVFLEHPERRLSVSLSAEPRPLPEESPPAPHEAEDPNTAPAWASGTFVLAPVEYDPTPAAGVLSELSGEFALRGSLLEFADVHVAVGPTATASVALTLELETPDQVGLTLKAALEDARASAVSDALGLPPGLMTGTTDLNTDLRGFVRRGDSGYEGVHGTLSFTAEDGAINQKLPMLVALATVSDGFNPFSSMEAMQYQSIEGEFRIENGFIHADRFELEGPVRVYATGTLGLGEAREIDGVVGAFLFQRTRELLGMVPLVNLVVPGSDHGMVGAYYSLAGSWDNPKVATMKMKSLQEQLPDIVTKPFELLHALFTPSTNAKPDGPDSSKSKDSKSKDSKRTSSKRKGSKSKRADSTRATPSDASPTDATSVDATSIDATSTDPNPTDPSPTDATSTDPSPTDPGSPIPGSPIPSPPSTAP